MAPIEGEIEYIVLLKLHFSILEKRLKQMERILAYHKWHGKYKDGSVSDNMKTLSHQMKLAGERLETKGPIFYMQHIYTVKNTL